MRSARLAHALALLLTVTLVACNQGPKHDPAADAAALDKAAAAWLTAYNGKDAAGVAAIYTEDGQLLPPGAAPINGRTAIQEYWAHDIENSWAALSVKEETTVVSGDWAWRGGAFSVESAGATGKFLEVWKRVGDGWQLHKDIWNADVMPAAAPPAEPAPAEQSAN